jgi:hypothetical protein
MMNTRLLSWLYWTSILVLFISGVVLPEVLSGLRQDYKSTANFISELGATGAEYQFIVNHFSFLPIAICSLSAILCLAVRMPATKTIKTGLGFWMIGLRGGYLTAFLFPCDCGCPIEGSTSQMIHNLTVLVVYPVGILGLIVLAIGLKQSNNQLALKGVSIVAVLAAVCFPMMLLPEQADLRGFWQRLADFAMFLLILGLGFLFPQPAENR